MKKYIVGTHKKHFREAILMSIHYMFFPWASNRVRLVTNNQSWNLKNSVQKLLIFFSYFWIKKYVMGTHQKHLIEVLLMNTHNICFYFIVSGEISEYLMKIKVVSITSELISYHFTIVNDTIYIFTLRFGRLRFSSLFQKWMLPPLQIFEHL